VEKKILEKAVVKKCDNVCPDDMIYDFVKIDTEGKELQVLQGMQKILRNKSKFLIIEINNNFNEVVLFFKKFNFKCICLTKMNAIFSKK
jgi:hypothetical protein